MIRGMVMQSLRRLQREKDPPRQLILAERLREQAERARLLPGQRREVVAALESLGIRISGSKCDDDLAVGETWLPLFGPIECDVGRLRVRSAGPAGVIETALGREARDQLRRVRDVVVDRLARKGMRPRCLADRGYAVDLQCHVGEASETDGPSLGLAFAVAMLSLELEQRPRDDTAGSSEIGRDGRLRRVDRIIDKIRALCERRPEVRRLVVARSQERPAESLLAPIEWVAVESLDEAWEAFGLRPSATVMPPLDLGEIRAKLAEFQEAAVPGYGKAAWLGKALEAWCVASAAGAHPEGERLRARALGFAALFSLHAGDVDAANRYVADIGEREIEGLYPAARASLRIIRALVAIDTDEGDAVDKAEKAMSDAESLPDGDDRDLLLGRVYGTLGRALVHAGRANEEAVRWL
ncbi:MAG: hypothetical protein QME96_17190, partial [Myxococcota bacterium]|nr:hypothetical protein [Myxococcota bacterium]